MTFFSMRTLEGVERVVVIVAAFAALLPIYQWYSEAEARRIERVSTFANAGQSCYDWYKSSPSNSGIEPDYLAISNVLKSIDFGSLDEKSSSENLKKVFEEVPLEVLFPSDLNRGMMPVCLEIVSMLHQEDYVSEYFKFRTEVMMASILSELEKEVISED